MENLKDNQKLSVLNLSSNRIKKVEGLMQLTQLNSLYLDKNYLSDYESLENILECPSLSVVAL